MSSLPKPTPEERTARKATAASPGFGAAGGDNFKVPTGRGVLSAAEIEALLRPDIPENAFEEPKSVEPVVPKQLEAGPTLDTLLKDAGALAARLTLCLRQECDLEALLRVDAASFSPLSHLVSKHEGAPLLILFADQSGAVLAGLTLDQSVATMIVERSCGAKSARPLLSGPRALSKLDIAILEEVLQPLATALDPSFSIACIEADRSAAHALLPPGKAMLAELSCNMLNVAGKAGFARLSIPAAPPETESADKRNMGQMMTELTARIASLNVPVSQLSDLKPGSVLLLGLPTDQPVDLLTGGHSGDVVAQGDVGRRGNKIAIRVSKRFK